MDEQPPGVHQAVGDLLRRYGAGSGLYRGDLRSHRLSSGTGGVDAAIIGVLVFYIVVSFALVQALIRHRTLPIRAAAA
jgi:hypothetical protein